MPNYVRNVVSFEGEGAEEALRSHMNGVGDFDFNTVDPLPDGLEIECSGAGYNGLKIIMAMSDPRFSPGRKAMTEEEYDSAMSDLLGPNNYRKAKVEGKKELDEIIHNVGVDHMTEALLLGNAYLDNIRRVGSPTWYEWQTLHWGTKWNAMDADVKPDGRTVQFDTAWAAPWPIFEGLARMHPGLTIRTVSSNESRSCGCSERVYRNGGLSEERDWEGGAPEDEEIYYSLWPERH